MQLSDVIELHLKFGVIRVGNHGYHIFIFEWFAGINHIIFQQLIDTLCLQMIQSCNVYYNTYKYTKQPMYDQGDTY